MPLQYEPLCHMNEERNIRNLDSCLVTFLASSMSYNPDCGINSLKSIFKQHCVTYLTSMCAAKKSGVMFLFLIS